MVSKMFQYKHCRVLVVDDEEFCLSTLSTLLHKAGIDVTYQVDFCINGEEAVNIVTEAYNHDFRYKIIFTDFNMPIMDGIEST